MSKKCKTLSTNVKDKLIRGTEINRKKCKKKYR